MALRVVGVVAAVAVLRVVQLEPNAQKTNGYQENRNVLVSKKARADSIPGGFFQDVLDRIEFEPVREALGAALEARIPQA